MAWPMIAAAGIGAAGSIIGGRKQRKGIDAGIRAQREMYEQSRADLSPWRTFGEGYIKRLADMDRFKAPTPEEARLTPGYQFRLDEGTRALENSAIARGGLLSGNAMRDITSFGQDYASSEYDNVYNRAQSEYQNELARLMGKANFGYGAAGGSAGLSMNQGNALANLYGARGQASARTARDLSDTASGWLGYYNATRNPGQNQAYPMPKMTVGGG